MNQYISGQAQAGGVAGRGCDIASLAGAKAASYPEAHPLQPGLVAITADSVAGRAERLNLLASRLGRIADRIYGSQPEQASPQDKGQRREADADRLQAALDLLDAALERGERNLLGVEQL